MVMFMFMFMLFLYKYTNKLKPNHNIDVVFENK